MSHTFEIYPTEEQEIAMNNILLQCCNLHNLLRQERVDELNEYMSHKKNNPNEKFKFKINRNSQEKLITKLKNQEENNPYKNIHTHILQGVSKRLSDGFDRFYRKDKSGKKFGLPRIKKECTSFSFKDAGNNNGVKIIRNTKIKIHGVGEMNINVYRKPKGKLKTIAIKKQIDKWYAVLVTEIERKNIVNNYLPKTGKSVGIDLGVKVFATFSDGNSIQNPKPLKKASLNIKSVQRQLETKNKDSNRYKKAKNKLAKLHLKVANVRKDFLHKESRKIVNNYDQIAIEDLNIKKMIQSKLPNMSKNISDVSWGRFIFYLTYKAANAGRELKVINPAFTTQDCSSCGNRVVKTLSERFLICPCGYEADRDLNAAKNILNKAKFVETGVGATYGVKTENKKPPPRA